MRNHKKVIKSRITINNLQQAVLEGGGSKDSNYIIHLFVKSKLKSLPYKNRVQNTGNIVGLS
jgi:hypothetical protein